MENNWKEKINTVLMEYPILWDLYNEQSIEFALELMNLVFEATKKECADKAKTDGECKVWNCEGMSVYKQSILKINKPNL